MGCRGAACDDMDRSVAPGDDFVRYAVGKWIDTTEIPPERSSVTSVSAIKEKTSARVRDIIAEAAAANAAKGSDTRKIGYYFTSFMDEQRIEQLGVRPLKRELDAIAAIKTLKDLSIVLGASIRSDVDVLNLGTFYTSKLTTSEPLQA